MLALAILEHANLRKLGPIEHSAMALELFVRTHRAVEADALVRETKLTGAALEQRIVERANELWPQVRDGSLPPLLAVEPGHHSSAVIVVDKEGSVVVGTHTIEGGNWGQGIFIGGIPLGAERSHGPGWRCPMLRR